MLAIQLPAGTDRVTVRDIPALIADALHPAVPADTPRQIIRLNKTPTSAENAVDWCGEGCQPFPVSLTDEDMADLTAGAWASLPPLVLPINENQWKPYADAYRNNPPTGWNLETMTHDTSSNERMLHHDAAEEWLAAVRKTLATQAHWRRH